MKSFADPRFWRAYHKLPADAQRRADAAYDIWLQNPFHPSCTSSEWMTKIQSSPHELDEVIEHWAGEKGIRSHGSGSAATMNTIEYWAKTQAK